MQSLSTDVRFGGRWTPAQTLKNELIWRALQLAVLLAPAIPFRALGSIAYALAGKRARENARDALGDERLAHASFRNLAGHLGDVLLALRGRPLPSLPIAPEALAVLDEARAEGKGVVFASAHLGPWERVAATLVRNGVPLVTMARESYDPRITRLVDRLRENTNVPSIPRGAASAPTKIVRALKSGAVLGMPMDLKTRAPSVTVPFFGRPAETVLGPARIALRTGAPLVVGTIERVRDSELVTATRIPHDPDPIALTAALNREIERRIRTVPEQWVWMHPRWGRDPREQGGESPRMV